MCPPLTPAYLFLEPHRLTPLHTRGTNAQAIGECVAVCVVFLLHFGQWDLALLLFSSLLLYGPFQLFPTPPLHALHACLCEPRPKNARRTSPSHPFFPSIHIESNRLRHQPLLKPSSPRFTPIKQASSRFSHKHLFPLCTMKTGFVTIRITLWRRKFREMSNKKDNEIHERATDTLVNFETVKVRG